MSKACSVEGCKNKYRCKGYCNTHYNNYLKYGDPIKICRYDHVRRDHYETYRIWKGIRDRCNRKTNPKYKDYGGRGIKVCDRWCGAHGAKHFLEDMGERPSPEYSIDRIDVNGDYEPNNCRWVDKWTQARNKRNSSKYPCIATYNTKKYGIRYMVKIRKGGIKRQRSFATLDDALLYKKLLDKAPDFT